eukprot:CAMPEP_0119360740 /NCGR_PEP_ID=MMETSP1334-20130426/8252_1 /TAXON_ID=127549 /ORGANISM="Calcidiscus leptoporus, Strain RCC1130" /LENGTH=185 /DNA_ID=CAMNT_0007375629 /DNA_START=439 /DNA_END=993 /DNA_ORIENTATION=+
MFDEQPDGLAFGRGLPFDRVVAGALPKSDGPLHKSWPGPVHAIVAKSAVDAAQTTKDRRENSDEPAQVLAHDEEIDVVVRLHEHVVDVHQLKGAPAVAAVRAACDLHVPCPASGVEVRSRVEEVAASVLDYRQPSVELAALSTPELALLATARLPSVNYHGGLAPPQRGKVRRDARRAEDAQLGP